MHLMLAGRRRAAPGQARSIAALLALLLAPTALARANGYEVQFFGSTVFPVGSCAVQLVEESVDITLPPGEDAGFVEPERNATCRYVLRNLADTTVRFSMAFVVDPTLTEDVSKYEPGTPSGRLSESYEPRLRFAVLQDGTERQVRYAGVAHDLYVDDATFIGDSLPVWDLTIAAGATSAVEMKYFAGWSVGRDGWRSGFFRYRTRPAALWAGRIERATFRLRLGDRETVRRLRQVDAPWSFGAEPSGHRWQPDGVSWEFRDWEPDSDIVVVVSYPGGDDYCDGYDAAWSPWTPDRQAALPNITTGLDRPATVLERRCGRGVLIPGARVADAPVARLLVHVRSDGVADDVRYPGARRRDALTDYDFSRIGRAMCCVRTWLFSPSMRAGRAVDSWVEFRVPLDASD